MAHSYLKFNKGFIETTHLFLYILIFAIIISVVLTAFMFIKPDNTRPEIVVPPSPTLIPGLSNFLNAKEEYLKTRSGENMVKAIGSMKISDELALKMKADPNYQATVSSLLIPWPEYSQTATADEVKVQYRQFLIENVSMVSDTAFDEKSNSNLVLGQLLTVLYYVANVGNSPEMAQADVASWRSFLESGKSAASIIAEAPLRKREETIEFTKNFFKQPVFVNLGVK